MSKKALLGAVLPFISNPVVLTVVTIGAVGLTVYELLSDKKKKQVNGFEAVPDGSEPFDESLIDEVSTVPETASLPWEPVESTVNDTVHTAVEEPFTRNIVKEEQVIDPPITALTDEELKKEMIRQTMSELGKRSAAARANKKNSQQI